MIVVKLREAMIDYKRRTQKPMTYELLAKRSGVARRTLEAIARDPGYNTTLAKIDAICEAIDVPLDRLVERRPGRQPETDRKRTAKKHR